MDDPKTFGERLLWARKKAKLTQKQVAARIGMSQGALSDLENDESQSSGRTPELAHLYGVDARWLASGKGRAKPPNFDENVKEVAPGVRAYPVISYIQAGALGDIHDPYPPGFGFDTEYGDDDASQYSFFLEIEGRSMWPDFIEGDRVRIDPGVRPRPGECVAAKNHEEKATFKKYRVRGIDARGNEVFDLVPINPDYPTLRSDEMRLSIIGTMTEHRRKYRRK